MRTISHYNTSTVAAVLCHHLSMQQPKEAVCSEFLVLYADDFIVIDYIFVLCGLAFWSICSAVAKGNFLLTSVYMICESKTNCFFFLGGQKGPSVSHPEIHRNPEIRNPCMHTSSTGSQSHWVIPNYVTGAGLLWTTGDSFIHRSALGQGGKKETRNRNCCLSHTDNTVCKLLILFKGSWKSHNSDI